MYVLLLLGIAALGFWLIQRGRSRRRRGSIALGTVVLGLGALFFAFLSFYAELLWFDSAGQARRFWVMVAARTGSVALGAGLGAGLLWLLTAAIPGDRVAARRWPERVGAVLGLFWGLASWEPLLLFLYRVPSGFADPILGRDTGFYLFVLPLVDRLYGLALVLVLVALLAAVLSLFGRSSDGEIKLRLEPFPGLHPPRALWIAFAALMLVLSAGLVLDVYHLLYSEWGVVRGAGWTDVHVRLPAYLLVAVLTFALAAVPAIRPLQARGIATVRRFVSPQAAPSASLGGLAAVGLLIWLFGLQLIPRTVQWLVVEPNEISFETPYIEHNIAFTRRGFRLDRVEERQFPASGDITPALLQRSADLLAEARLWDWRALDAVYKQFQEIRLYYEFADVDMDRYRIGDRYRQVMISARELAQRNLPEQSQTFVNLRLKYTHGYGLTLTTVSDFTPDGLPNLLVKDIPPRSEAAELRVERPEIYYGELTSDAAVVNTREPEFDHPTGDQNAYLHYPGRGGVPLANLWWRKFVFGWRFGGTQLFLSTYPTEQSRVMFHRRVGERAATLAPFLRFEPDPYVVLVDGRLYWLIDAYTTSSYFPYSEPFSSREVIEYVESQQRRRLSSLVSVPLDGANYVRNSVKVVVDAFDGTTTFYVFDDEDPVVRVWRRAFPELFRDADQMPPGLRAHVRYPSRFLLAQGLVYAKYHMSDPAVFYNQEDLWVRATEKYYAQLRPVEPYYVMWQLPGSLRAEFVLILPFTPKNRQVLIGWIAGLCDAENYGRFLAYKLPKERRVLGPQQVETKIDQHRFLSGQLTLWDQRGSQVIRGNVLAIPIEDTLLYVEPIYLQAETAAYPELRLVVVMHGDHLSYGETFQQALTGLLDGAVPAVTPVPARPDSDLGALAERAGKAFDEYLRLQAEQRFEEAARALEELRDALAELRSSGD